MAAPYSFGTWLSQQRRQQGLTQAALAKRVGCATVTIKKIESEERKPSAQMARRLAESLGIPQPAWEPFVQAARQGQVPPAPQEARPRSNLRAPRNAFVGREQEQARLMQLLRQSHTRLVTLVGPPGVGKTRLALQVAWNSQEFFPAGVYWLDLAPISNPADIVTTAVQALNLPESAVDPSDQLREWLATRTILLILDNCEQIESPGRIIVSLLDSAPRLKLLLTSRLPLDIYGERLFPVAPLPVGNRPGGPANLADSPALALFQERVQEVQPDFALTEDNFDLVTTICRELDGLPLAIELAARQLRHSTLSAINDRIDRRLELLQKGPLDWRPRHQTFRAAVQWSLDLLPLVEQRHFARLGVFAGDFSAEAASALTSRTSFQNLLLASLVQRSGDDRYFLHQTVRDYAREQLVADQEWERTCAAHARFFRDLAGEAGPHLLSAAVAEWQQRLASERSNIQAALVWCRDHDPALGLDLAAHMWRLWYIWGQYRTGEQWLEWFLNQVPAPTLIRARALRGRGVLLTRFGQFEQAQPLFAACLAIARQHQDTYQIGSALMGLGDSYHGLGRYDAAWPNYQEALHLFEADGDMRCVSWALGGVASIAYHHDQDLPRALDLMRKSVEFARMADDPRHLGWMLGIAADLETTAGDRERALEMLREAYQQFLYTGDLPGQSYARLRMGAIYLHTGRYQEARSALAEARQLAQETYTLSYEAQALCLLGMVAVQQGQYVHGVEMCAAAEARHRFLRQRLLPADLALLNDSLAEARNHIGTKRYDEIWSPATPATNR